MVSVEHIGDEIKTEYHARRTGRRESKTAARKMAKSKPKKARGWKVKSVDGCNSTGTAGFILEPPDLIGRCKREKRSETILLSGDDGISQNFSPPVLLGDDGISQNLSSPVLSGDDGVLKAEPPTSGLPASRDRVVVGSEGTAALQTATGAATAVKNEPPPDDTPASAASVVPSAPKGAKDTAGEEFMGFGKHIAGRLGDGLSRMTGATVSGPWESLMTSARCSVPSGTTQRAAPPVSKRATTTNLLCLIK
jgi:hypothetical protein